MKVVCLSSPLSVQHQTCNSGELRAHELRHVFQEGLRKTGWRSDTDRHVEDILGKLHKAAQHCAAADEDDSGSRLPFVPCVTDFVSDEMNDLFCPGLDDFSQNGLRNRTWLARSNAGDLEDFLVL